MTTLRITRGDSFDHQIVLARSGLPVDLTGASSRFTVKASLLDSDASAILSKTVGAGITIVSPATSGTLLLQLTAANTTVLTPGAYYFDWQVTESNGRNTTVELGIFLVDADVSRTSP